MTRRGAGFTQNSSYRVGCSKGEVRDGSWEGRATGIKERWRKVEKVGQRFVEIAGRSFSRMEYLAFYTIHAIKE